MGTSLLLSLTAALLGLYKLWGFKERLRQKEKMPFSKLVSPRHVIESVNTTFQKRPEKKRFVLVGTMVIMLTHMMAAFGETYCQFMFTKRMFQWKVDTYSYYQMLETVIQTSGMVILFPIFHYFNVNDNLIVMLSCLSGFSAQIFRGFAKEEWMLFASTAVNFGNHIFSPPIRSQMTRCVHPHETGKIFAMLASVESFVPILASATFTRLYNYTADHQYPWVGSFYFAGAACILIGLTIATSIYCTLGGKQVSSYSDEESIDDKSKELTKF